MLNETPQWKYERDFNMKKALHQLSDINIIFGMNHLKILYF